MWRDIDLWDKSQMFPIKSWEFLARNECNATPRRKILVVYSDKQSGYCPCTQTQFVHKPSVFIKQEQLVIIAGIPTKITVFCALIGDKTASLLHLLRVCVYEKNPAKMLTRFMFAFARVFLAGFQLFCVLLISNQEVGIFGWRDAQFFGNRSLCYSCSQAAKV